MLRRTILAVLFISVFVAAASNAQAGKVELTTYYPAPEGQYTNVQADNSLKLPVKTSSPTSPKVGEIWVETT